MTRRVAMLTAAAVVSIAALAWPWSPAGHRVAPVVRMTPVVGAPAGSAHP